MLKLMVEMMIVEEVIVEEVIVEMVIVEMRVVEMTLVEVMMIMQELCSHYRRQLEVFCRYERSCFKRFDSNVLWPN